VKRRRFTLLSTSLLASTLLAACGDHPAQAGTPPASAPSASSSGVAAPHSAAQQAYELAAQGHGFSVGPLMAANTVYVFFDTTCPHCAHLWEAAKPLQGRLKVVWMPVGFLRPASLTQGATILAAPDPVAAMSLNETRMLAHQDGIPVPAELPASALAQVKANTALLEKLRVDSVPLVLWRNARTGEYGMQTGAMSTATLTAMVGL
jgi:thiol:disulfide interchange protein DsbG